MFVAFTYLFYIPVLCLLMSITDVIKENKIKFNMNSRLVEDNLMISQADKFE